MCKNKPMVKALLVLFLSMTSIYTARAYDFSASASSFSLIFCFSSADLLLGFAEEVLEVLVFVFFVSAIYLYPFRKNIIIQNKL